MSIDVAGMIQNMLHGGFTLTSCISELIDNSLSANATQIRITIEGDVIYYCDNGSGMDKEGLRLSNIFHLRGESRDSKHGRFGIGGKQAYVQLSNKQWVTIYSKVTTVNMIELDYRRFIEENEMHLHVSEIGMSSLPIWEKYSFGKGSLFVIQSTPEIVKQLKDLIECKSEKNILYHLGLTYHDCLSICSMEIVTDKSYTVMPIDLLLWGTSLHYQNKVHVYSDGTNIVFPYSYLDNDEKFCRDFTDSKRGKEVPFMVENLQLVGTIDIRASYRKDWKDVMVLPFEKCTQEEFEKLNGKFILRNGKKVHHIAAKKKLTGDTDLRDTELNSHIMIGFQANQVMDTLFGVEINKSKLNMDTINEELWGTILYLIKDAYKLFNKPIIANRPAKTETSAQPYSKDAKPYGQKTETKDVPKTNPQPVPDPRAAEEPHPPAESKATVPVPIVAENTRPAVPESKATVPVPKATEKPAESMTKVALQPKSPPARPAPEAIVFSKAEYHIMIHDTKKNKTYQIAYRCQYHLQCGALEETYSKIGYARFIEYIAELQKLNLLIS